jgi:hypothetical protein
MNIFLELENDLSKDQINSITIYSCSSNARFKKLMDCFFDPNHRIVLRASWIVIQSIDYKRSMLDPYIQDLVAAISHPNMAEHLVRNSLRILELIDISEQYHGEVMNACFGFIESPDTPIAIKAYSLTIVYKLSIIYPEIQDELKCIIEANWDNETPAFKSRGKKILSLINKSRRMK